MSPRRSILVSTALVASGLLWYLFRPDALVISKTVNEPFPAAQESQMEEPSMGQSSMGEGSGMARSSMGNSSAMGGSSGMARSSMSNSSAMGVVHEAGQMANEEEPVRLAHGRFHTNAHETKGVATIYQLDDGRRVLRLTEFSTSNGPDVRVYLVAAADVQEEDAAKRAGIVDLGALKGNIGDQNYDVPEGLDLSKYRAVSIWCRRFSVNFG
ncbi:MAG TPA: DM13 domain-containing protein, partial [Gemmatimonadales bacterium]|nr:DM13 domain-containing protein [Gemmatimonadales bacterium]